MGLKTTLLLIVFALFTGCSEQSQAKPELAFDFKSATHNIIPLGPNGAWDAAGVYNPYVVKYEGIFYLFYLGNTEVGNPQSASMGFATSQDGYNFEKFSGNPIFDDNGTVGFFTLLVEDDGWTMLFRNSETLNLMRATASGPKGPWVLDEAPIWEPDPTSWRNASWGLGLFKVGEQYRLYFQGNARYQGEPRTPNPGLGLATSNDTKNWVFYDDPNTGDRFKGSDPLIFEGEKGSWHELGVSGGNPIHTEEAWEWFYFGYGQYLTEENYFHIGYATSDDGTHWQTYEDNPVAKVEEELWPLMTTMKIDDTYYIYYDHEFGRGGISLMTGKISKLVSK